MPGWPAGAPWQWCQRDRPRPGRLQGLECARVNVGECTNSLTVGERGSHQLLAIAELLREVSRAEQCLAEPAVAGLALGPAEADQKLAAPGLFRRRALLEQFEGLLIPPDGVIGRERAQRLITRSLGVVNSAVTV